MQIQASLSEDILHDLLNGVDKPARYTGGELNSVVKGDEVRGRIALCFPDVYEVAESHIGLKILYHVVNEHPDFAAERVYALWPDLEKRARAAKIPLWSLETYRPLSGFDVVGFTLQYELSYPTVLGMIDHGGIPLRTADRRAEHPFIIGGGAGAFNAEPIADFFDGFLLGDGEEAIVPILETVSRGRARGASRQDILQELGALEGMYIPSHYRVTYRGKVIAGIEAMANTPKAHVQSKHKTPRVTRRTLVDLDAAPYPTKTIVPNVTPVHDRVSIEIQRGCSQACRFCQAGMITRPTRQRRPETVLKLAEESLASCGTDEVGLLSLSAGDYQPINEVLSEFFNRYQDDNIGISLPSMRTETMTPELAQQVATVRKSGFTLAPEAGSERMRKVINKTNSEENLMNAVRATVTAGWRHLKFYFMIGLPTETDEDVDAIAALGERAREVGRQIRRDMNVTVSVSTFVPKPHTAFQWEAQVSLEETRRKHRRLSDRLRQQKIGFRYHSPEQSFLEGVFSRGDRRLGAMLEAAAKEGCRLDAWSEHFDFATWRRLLDEHLAPLGLTAEDYLRERGEDEVLPWDHLDAGILKKFLLRDRHRAYQAATIDDCAFTDHCYACGGCDLGNPYRAKLKDDAGERLVELRPTVFSALEEERPAAADLVPARSRLLPVVDGDNRTRLRFRYAKLGRAFHMSHLDVKDHIERAVRLSKMPVVYSQGFRPRPRLSYSPACPTGIASEAEYFEVICHGQVNGRDYAEALKAYLPSGLFVLDVEEHEVSGRALSDQIIAVRYVVSRPDCLTHDELRERVQTFAELPNRWVQVSRKKKARLLDARRHILSVMAVGDAMTMTVAFARGASLKVREAVASVLGVEAALAAKVRKVAAELGEHPECEEQTGGLASRSIQSDVPLSVLDLRAVGDRQGEEPRGRPRHAEPQTVPYAE